MVDKKKIMMDLGFKWLCIPLGIFIISLSGSALNLNLRFGVVSNLADDWVQQVMLLSVQLGYYSGLIAGFLVDTKSIDNMVTYIIGAVISLVGWAGLAFTIESEFDFLM